jgi:hypothetical protein
MGTNFLLADKTSKFVRVEASPAHTTMKVEAEEFACIANHFELPEMYQYSPNPPAHSVERVAYLKTWFKKVIQPVEISEIQKVQQTHEVEICPHVLDEFEGKTMNLETCWAWIAEVGGENLHFCVGSPCKNTYRIHSIPKLS